MWRYLSCERSVGGVKIAEEAKYDGYYVIVTSDKELSDKEIHDLYYLFDYQDDVILTMEKNFRFPRSNHKYNTSIHM